MVKQHFLNAIRSLRERSRSHSDFRGVRFLWGTSKQELLLILFYDQQDSHPNQLMGDPQGGREVNVEPNSLAHRWRHVVLPWHHQRWYHKAVTFIIIHCIWTSKTQMLLGRGCRTKSSQNPSIAKISMSGKPSLANFFVYDLTFLVLGKDDDLVWWISCGRCNCGRIG